jgi:tight adherence protein B
LAADDRSLNWKRRLQLTIEQAGMKLTPAQFATWTLGCGSALAALGAWKSWWLAVGLLLVGLPIPAIVIKSRKLRRQRKLCRQLPDAFAMISRAVKAGQTVPAALQIIADDFEPPISREFAVCYEQQNLGMSRESALRQLARRSGIMELQIFVVALLVQAQSGGDLVELLDNLSAMIRKRLKLKDRIRALTGEGRMQALVLTILPIVVLLGIIFLSPGYAKALLDRRWLLASTAAAQAAGTFWIRRIVNFDY